MEKEKSRHRISGLKQRWMLNSVLTISALMLVTVLIFGVSISSYYGATIRTGLEAKANTAANFFSNYVTRTYAEYYESAYKYIESFPDANVLELQFVGLDGSVEISSNSITSGSTPNTADIQQALSTGKISSWTGKSPLTAERVIAVSCPLVYSNGQTVGVMRYVSSMKLVDREVAKNVMMAVGAAAVAVLIVVFLNVLLVKSVVEPIQDITVMARQIAGGSYGIQINKQYRDEIGEMVEAINEMSMKISSAEKTQTEFISSVSHELRTPLTAITGWGETLIYDESLDAETKRGIGIILKEARRLTKMVEELLEFTRMQDGRFTLNVEQIDIVAELEDSIFTYRELLKQDDIELEYEPYMEELPLINGDPARLRQVFLNILDNAAKYARDGKKIVVSLHGANDHVDIRIRDYGSGLPEDELENVKMKFYKGSNAKERGSGIGLAVCDEIVRYHGGQLLIENAEGGGLAVTVRLPL